MKRYFLLKQTGSHLYLHRTDKGLKSVASMIGAALFREEEARSLVRFDLLESELRRICQSWLVDF
uniref:Uncharacterized protein n=1 Tax=viral metagenome TaxID=1070528 RepID=A0A6C0J2H0_9ZZZZ